MLRYVAVLALLVSIIVVATGCGDRGSAPRSDSEQGRLSHAELNTEASAICDRIDDQINALDVPQSIKQAIDFGDESIALTEQGIEELKALNPPVADEPAYNRMIAALEAAVIAMRNQQAHFRDRDMAGAEEAQAEFETASAEFDRSARELELTGCGQSVDYEPEAAANGGEANLAAMIVPKEELGGEFSAAKTTSSQRVDNAFAIADTIDPDDTPDALAGAGRVGGYVRVYQTAGAIIVLSVHVFDTESSAAAFVSKEVEDWFRLRGRDLGGSRIASANRFDVEPIGAGTVGWETLQKLGPVHRLYTTHVAFHEGGIAAFVTVSQNDSVDSRNGAQWIARTFAERIRMISSGSRR